VEIVEGFMDRLYYYEIESIVRAFKPDILGVHMVYHWQDDVALYNFLQMVKDQGLAKYITAYGFYPTIAFEDILLKCTAIDSIVVGEPELTFTELAAGGGANPSLPGLALRNGAGGISCERRPLIEDLDSLPLPVRTEAAFRLPEVNIQGGRGCYGGCTFCYINPFYGQGSRWRGRSPESIVAEIDTIMSDHGVTDFYFTDPNFFGPGEQGQERARRLASLLKPRNIRFGIEGRVNDIHDETIAALVEAGLRNILVGLESGRDDSLRRMNKRTTVAQNEEAIKILRRHRIEPNVGFIMFEPDSSLQDVRVNFEFLKRNNLLHNLPVTANVLYHHQIILKGTRAYRDLKEAGRLEIRDDTSYEGATTFTEPKMAQLAGIMRQVTNLLFARMSGIWSGKVEEPRDAKVKYNQINRLLVDIFEDSLRTLEEGGQFTEEQIALVGNSAGYKINEVLQ